MFIADVTVRFQNGATGAKVFEAPSRDQVYDDVHNFVYGIVQYAKAKQKNLVKSHSVSVKEVK
jgi:hypothetical protein